MKLKGLSACISLLQLAGPSPALVLAQSTDVLTYHNDIARTGQTLHEEILTPSNVNSTNFGKLRVLSTDGKVDAQPLYAAGINIPGQGQRNVLIVASEMDSVYAFDADSNALFWHVSLLAAGETPSDNRSCSQVSPIIGITATPVIDRALGSNGTVFVVAMSKASSTQYFQRLHALDLSTGVDRLVPATVAATYPGSGDGSVNGTLVFDPARYKERPGLLLLNGVVYNAWSSHCDIRPYTGWIMGYDAQTLAQTSVFNFTPNGSRGCVWMSGGGMAADEAGNIFFLAANGSFDTNLTASGFPNLGNFGNAFVKLSTTNGVLAIPDYFAPANTPSLNATDGDLGSGGALVLPDMQDNQGNIRRLAVGAGKDPTIYLVDRTNMGKFNPSNDSAVYQKVTGALGGAVFSAPAYFNGVLYYGPVGSAVKAFPFQNARLGAASSQTAHSFTSPGVSPSISANGTQNGILWAVDSNASLVNAVLRAYSAANLGIELYNSTQSGSRDNFGAGNKYITPTIASGRVYVGTTTGVGVFGLLDRSTLTPLQAWRDIHFGNPSNVGPGADSATPAGDGVENLIKYALGVDPFTPVSLSQFLIPSLTQISGENYGTITLTRSNRAPDVTYLVEVSSDMKTWSNGPGNTVTMTDIPTQLVVRDTAAVATAPRFMRLRITAP